MKVIIFIGTRPEAIKLVPIFKQLTSDGIQTTLVSTGQHKEMVEQIFSFFNIFPDVHFKIMKHDQSLGASLSNIINESYKLISRIEPQVVLVQGDTNTALGAALAAFYNQVDIGHVEAGLRTGEFYSPFPEEKNRELIGRLAKFHFAPTQNNKMLLLKENIDDSDIHVVGNTVIDALFIALKAMNKKTISSKLRAKLAMDFEQENYILITGHRRENHGQGIEAICKSLIQLSQLYQDFKFIYPVHLNPNIRDVVYRLLDGQTNIFLIDPLSYEEFIYLMQNCYLILTDSGGIQEEAPSLNKPVLLMRNSTERPEGIQSGAVRIVGADEDAIIRSVSNLISDQSSYNSMINIKNPYGDGMTSKKITDILVNHYD
jgi:UDP-N-acetylglucosamine 2-epimerase (non-hydrolysing)